MCKLPSGGIRNMMLMRNSAWKNSVKMFGLGERADSAAE